MFSTIFSSIMPQASHPTPPTSPTSSAKSTYWPTKITPASPHRLTHKTTTWPLMSPETTPTLQLNALYILLFLRDSSPQANDYHWALYLHTDSEPASGTKYHIRNESAGWVADHSATASIMDQFRLVSLLHIADVPFGWEAGVDAKIRAYDGALNEGLTCKTWLFKVLEDLRVEDRGYIVLRCDNLEALQDEVCQFGNGELEGAEENMKPRPIADSKICNLFGSRRSSAKTRKSSASSDHIHMIKNLQ